jgi:Domain of unknown function (DUF4390)
LKTRPFWPTFAACALLIGASTLAVGAAAVSRIVPLVDGNHLVVSFELADAYTPDVRQAIASGLRTTFTYDVELRMNVPGWVDRTVATAIVTASDRYDNLTRRHTLSRSVDGRIEESIVTEEESVVQRWLTNVARMPLCPTTRLDPSRDYYVRVSARARPAGTSLLGWASVISGQAKFTFIP